jgi:uncharacterized membrane protein YccC
VTARSVNTVAGSTVVVAGAVVLLPDTGSVVLDDTLAVLLKVPVAVGVTTMVTVALPG